MSDTHHEDDHAGHFIVPPKYYVINAVVITFLMFLTVFAAKFDFGHTNGLNLWIALGIAVAKSACIIAIFMGVKWSTPIVKVFALGAIGWLMIMFVFFLVDYASPKWGLGTPYSDYENPGQYPLPHAGAVVEPVVEVAAPAEGGGH